MISYVIRGHNSQRTTADNNLKKKKKKESERRNLEETNEWKGTFCLTIVDFEKTFDSLAGDIIWQVPEEYKVPKKIIGTTKSLYEGLKCRVVHEGKLTDSFELKIGGRLGCITVSDPIYFSVGQYHEQSRKRQKARTTVQNDGKVRRS
jgi:hypothetical protein